MYYVVPCLHTQFSMSSDFFCRARVFKFLSKQSSANLNKLIMPILESRLENGFILATFTLSKIMQLHAILLTFLHLVSNIP